LREQRIDSIVVLNPSFWVAVLMVLTTFLTGCGGVEEERRENRYSSAVWSPDGTQVAYFRRYVEYTHTSPRVSWLVGEEANENVLSRDQLFLCVNDLTGEAERVLTEIEYALPQRDPYTIPSLHTAVSWEGPVALLYGAGKRDVFSTGVRRRSVRGDQDELVEAGFEPLVALGRQGVRIHKGLELYSDAEGGYGYFDNQTIYMFNHNTRSVSVYLHDPLSREAPYVPPYDVTGR
jgi:hypothetical protein